VEVKSLPRAPEVLKRNVSHAWFEKPSPSGDGEVTKVSFHKYFQQIAKNLASGWQLVIVEVSGKSVRGPFVKSMPKRG
jgi:hypothetical protein